MLLGEDQIKFLVFQNQMIFHKFQFLIIYQQPQLNKVNYKIVGLSVHYL